MSNQELIGKISKIKHLQRLMDEAKAEMDALKDDVKAYMGDTDILIVGEYKVTYKVVKSVRLDSTALEKEMPDIYSQFAKTAETKRFIVA